MNKTNKNPLQDMYLRAGEMVHLSVEAQDATGLPSPVAIEDITPTAVKMHVISRLVRIEEVMAAPEGSYADAERYKAEQQAARLNEDAEIALHILKMADLERQLSA